MYGDPARLRADAQALASAGAELTVSAGRVAAAVAATQWQSSAADAMRRRMSAEVAGMRAVAAELAAAAAAMLRHAEAVEAMQRRIALVERALQSLVRAALHLATSAVGSLLPGADELAHRLRGAMARFPPRGHLDWLDVPGDLRRIGLPVPQGLLDAG